MSIDPTLLNQSDTFGLFNIGTTQLAVRLSALREVVPVPETISSIPAVAPGLVGAMNLREHIVPIMDLRSHMGVAAETKPSVVIVVTDGIHLLGVLADDLAGVVQRPVDKLLEVAVRGGSRLIFSHTMRGTDDLSVVSLLDVSTIFATPGLPLIEDPLLVDPASAYKTRVSASTKYTVVRCGEYSLALDIEHLHTTMPDVVPTGSVINSELCLGVTTYSGQSVPVVDPLVLLGLASLREDEMGPGLLVRLDGGSVVLIVSELLDIADIFPGDIMNIPTHSVSRPDLLQGVASLPRAEQCLVLDGAGLFADADVIAYSRVNTEDTSDNAARNDVLSALIENRQSGEANREPQLLYSIGATLATPLDQIEEIVAMPALVKAPGADYSLGTATHRNQVIPIVRLATYLGSEFDPASDDCVLLIATGAGFVGFAVEKLEGIEAFAWCDPDVPVPPVHPHGALKHSPTIQVEGSSRLLPQVDLKALASMLASTAV